MARLFSQVDRLEPTPEIVVSRMRHRLGAHLAGRKPQWFPPWLRAVALACISLVVLQVAAAATLVAWPSLRKRVLNALVGPVPASEGSTGSGAIGLPDVPPPVPVPVDVPAPPPASGTALPTEPISARPHKRAAIAPASHQPDAASDDAQLFSRALSQLNVQHDPEGALATLRTYRERHPAGLFQGEASVLEIRADLMLNKEKDALSSLDRLEQRSFAGVAQTTELRLLRAELLGRANRCGEALPVLAGYRSPSIPIELRERALYAGAICRVRLKDLQGSRGDLEEYLREFPQGRFVSEVRRALDRMR